MSAVTSGNQTNFSGAFDIKYFGYNSIYFGDKSRAVETGGDGGKSPGPHKFQFLEGTGGSDIAKFGPFGEIVCQIW